MTTVKKDSGELVIDGDRIALPAAVESVVQIRDSVIVLLDAQDNVAPRQNIWRLDTSGNVLWRAKTVRGPSGDMNCYVDIRERDGHLWASDWKGMEYKIDLETGNHIDRSFRK